MTKTLLLLATFLSAFLLFAVQPLFAKYLLPFYGGSASVWTVSIFFYSTILFGGYLYAAVLTRWSLVRARLIHTALLVFVGALLLTRWQTEGSGLLLPVGVGVDPAVSVWLTLAAVVGLPVLLLASTSVITQRLFAKHTAEDPYWLYAISNLGSFAGLLSYPFLVEPFVGLTGQSHIWTVAFVAFAVLLHGAWRQVEKIAAPTTPRDQDVDPNFPRGAIFVFAAVPTFLLAASTETLSQTIASFPLLWVVPLGVYLLSFVYAFRSDSGRFVRPFVVAVMGMIIVLLFVILPEINSGALAFWSAFFCSLCALFFVCVHFHARAYQLRPNTQNLGPFYVWFTLGGALGSGIVGMVLPSVLDRQVELYWLLGALLIYSFWGARPWLREALPPLLQRSLAGVIFLLATAVPIAVTLSPVYDHHERNFYGTLKVGDVTRTFGGEERSARYLVNGATTHGIAPLDADLAGTATSYYGPESGFGLVIRSFAAQDMEPRLAVIGLGVGVASAYCSEVSDITYIEINPAVLDFARTHFSYLDRCPERTRVTLGDGRLELERLVRQGESFDVIMMDAFTDDAIPAHLLTTEAFVDAYLPLLSPKGVLAFHISNKYLNLAKPIVGAAKQQGYAAIVATRHAAPDTPWIFSSQWILVTDPKNASTLTEFPGVRPYDGSTIVWTDQKSSVLQTLSLTGSNVLTQTK